MGLGRSALRAFQYQECVEQSRRAASQAGPLGDAGYETLVIALLLAGAGCALLTRFDEAEELLAQALREAESRGDLIHVAGVLNNRALVWNGRRDVERLTRDLDRVRSIARQTGFAPLEFHAEANLGEIYYSNGDLDQAGEHLERAVKISSQLWGDTAQTFRVELLRARSALYRNDVARARAILSEVRERESRELSQGKKDAQLTPGDALLADMLELASREADEAEWASLRARCMADAALQELAEVLEIEGLGALRHGERERGRSVLTEALRVAESAPGLLVNRIARELAKLA
jgi:tetratricopeptide (TPR) repeat protein